jgi:type II secretory pathway pseudopilin PulG
MRSGSSPGQRGFTYIAMLVAVALIGLGLAATGQVWSQSRQREKEQELLFIGNQFREAIERYYRDSPGAVKRYPQTLEELLHDKRQITVKRYLRRIYRDPMTGKAEWGEVVGPEGIIGVHSMSDASPLKTGGFLKRDAAFDGASRYSDWHFIYQPTLPPEIPKPPAKPG